MKHHKRCWACKAVKLATEFGRDKHKHDGRQGRCLDCKHKADKLRWATQRDENFAKGLTACGTTPGSRGRRVYQLDAIPALKWTNYERAEAKWQERASGVWFGGAT